MTEQATGTDAPAQSVNGRGPVPADDPPDTGERWLGILVIAAGCFLLLVGIDRVTGGQISARFTGDDDASG